MESNINTTKVLISPKLGYNLSETYKEVEEWINENCNQVKIMHYTTMTDTTFLQCLLFNNKEELNLFRLIFDDKLYFGLREFTYGK